MGADIHIANHLQRGDNGADAIDQPWWGNTGGALAALREPTGAAMNMSAARRSPAPGLDQRKAAVVTPVAWEVNGEIDLAQWVEAGRRLGAMSRCSQWWIGDWIRYGNARFGERYTRAMEITGYDVQSLMNMVWIASTFEISRRREKLSWSHHECVASLDETEQEHWLGFASERRLSVADLRLELRAARSSPAHGADVTPEAVSGPTEAHVVICPECGTKVPMPQSLGGRVEGEK